MASSAPPKSATTIAAELSAGTYTGHLGKDDQFQVDMLTLLAASSSGSVTMIIQDNLTTTAVDEALSANQGVVLNDADIASGAVVGDDIVLTKNDASTISIVTAGDAIVEADDQTGDGGSATTLARTDHKHVAQQASNTPSTPTGDVLSTDVDSAIGELEQFDVASAAVLGSNLILTLKSGLTVSVAIAADALTAPDDATGDGGTAITLARSDHKHAEAGVSADADNLLEVGTDGLHLMNPDTMISADADNMLIKGSDGKMSASLAAADVGIPATGDYVMGWSNGALTAFVK